MVHDKWPLYSRLFTMWNFSSQWSEPAHRHFLYLWFFIQYTVVVVHCDHTIYKRKRFIIRLNSKKIYTVQCITVLAIPVMSHSRKTGHVVEGKSRPKNTFRDCEQFNIFTDDSSHSSLTRTGQHKLPKAKVCIKKRAFSFTSVPLYCVNCTGRGSKVCTV